MSADLSSFIAHQQATTSELLLRTLSDDSTEFSQARACDNKLLEAMRYSLLNGGKRIRPVLTHAAAHAIAEPTPATATFAAAVECVHAYSLAHDDLPAMDDDDLRRGKPTCHVAFDEATAILAGDGLQCHAFELIASAELPATQAIRAIALLAQAAGARGMVLGQAIDLASINKRLSLADLEGMHRHKTGALITAAVLLGGLSANASEQQQAQLRIYAEAIGLAFQVQDDIIDVTSDTAILGKTQGADANRNKPTYVSLLGLEGARQKASELLTTALDALENFGAGAYYLRGIARYIVDRDH